MPIHLRAAPGDYAEAVLLPGDPLRAKYIAETYLDGPTQRNAERGLLGYTGTYKGRSVSIQGSLCERRSNERTSIWTPLAAAFSRAAWTL